MFRSTLAVIFSFPLLIAGPVFAVDWPQWRYDAGHTASSPEELPPRMFRRWTRKFTPRRQAWQDPINDQMMTYDKSFEPIVAAGRMFVGFNDSDKLLALDAASGVELWRFYADAPVRMAPAAYDGKVYFVADDGFLYCVETGSGKLLWKFRGGPDSHKCVGNERIISAWPARGGPVVRDGVVYFAASIWPFMGIFIHALDAQTGKQVWVNDTTGGRFSDQPHVTFAFGGIAPQGQLVATADRIVVPGGRSVPAGLDRKTGKLLYYRNGGDGQGWGSFVVADDEHYYARADGRDVIVNDLAEGNSLGPGMWQGIRIAEPVLHNGLAYVAEKGNIRAVTFVKTTAEARRYGIDLEKKDEKGQPLVKLPTRHTVWEIEVDGSGDLIRAGSRLYAAKDDTIAAVELPTDEQALPKIAWTMPTAGKVTRLLAAGGHLFAATGDGSIVAFGAEAEEQNEKQKVEQKPEQKPVAGAEATLLPVPGEQMLQKARTLVEQSGTRSGYAFYFGVDDAQLLQALAAVSELRIAAVDPDPAKVASLRRTLDERGLYGNRISVQVGDPATFKAPSYVAHLTVVGREMAKKYGQPDALATIYRSVRPYGGCLWLPLDQEELASVRDTIAGGRMEKARAESLLDGLLIRRDGPLLGAADWTHQYGDMANTLKSNDRLVKLPLGVLWFGGNSHVDVLPRHGNGPPEQVIGGRLFIEGLDQISARDVYSGRVLWKVKFEPKEFDTFGVYYDKTLNPDPLSGKSQGHIPGARMRGTNFVATDKYVYVAMGSSCRVLEAATGKSVRTISLPEREGKHPRWAFIGVYEDLLLGGLDFADYRGKDKDLPSQFSRAASGGLIAIDRGTGKELWQVGARYGFAHNGIVAGNGRIFLLDLLPKSKAVRAAQRGQEPPNDQRLICLDAASGKEIWSKTGPRGVWLSYSVPRDILVVSTDSQPHRWSNLSGRVPWRDKTTGIVAYRGKDGAESWKNDTFAYDGPLILHNDILFSNIKSNWREKTGYSGAIRLGDGKPSLRTNPLTGDEEPWRITRNYGCNSVIASEYLMTFRSGAAGYFDLTTGAGTGSLGGFKSSCTANMVIAGGVLNAPDYTRACNCSFQNQTSLALVHMPDIKMERWTTHYEPLQWSNSGYRSAIPVDGPIRRLGVNLGAPGDRMADDGTLWLEYPLIRSYQGGDSYDVSIALDGDPTQTKRRFEGAVVGPLPWVGASNLSELRSLFVDLRTGGEETRYTVRLHFAELETIDPGHLEKGQGRAFNVELQGDRVLENFNILQEAGGPNKSIVKEFKNIVVRDALKIKLSRTAASKYPAVLSGVEIIAE